MSNHPGISIVAETISLALFSKARGSCGECRYVIIAPDGILTVAIVRRDGNGGGVRQDELDLVQSLAVSPVVDGILPTRAAVAETVQEHDSRRMSGERRDNQWGSTDGHGWRNSGRARKGNVVWKGGKSGFS
jgi:hypothetical protein